MKPRELSEFMTRMFAAKLPFLVQGIPGIGKTDLIMEAAKRSKCDLILSHPAVGSPIDYKGLPLPDGKGGADFTPIGDLRKLVKAKKPTIFFMDDIGQAPPSVQAALMQLFLARQIGEHKVSDHITFAGATNRAEDRAGVHQMLEPVKSRFSTIVKLESDVDQWVQDFAIPKRMPPVLIAFILWKRDMLCDFQPKPGLENSPVPRTVANLGVMLREGVLDASSTEAMEGAVGKGFMIEFTSFLQVYSQLPNIEDALNAPDSVAIPTNRPDVAFAMTSSAAGAVDVKRMGNFVKLISRFGKPVEVFGMLLLKERGNAFKENPAFVNWASSNSEYLF
jgi:hypothetical protein